MPYFSPPPRLLLPSSVQNSHRKLYLFCLLLSFQTLPASAAKVLGAGETLSIDLVSKALIGIIMFTIGYEYFTEYIETKLEGTPYVKIVNQVYKELTVMGLISFVVFMIGQVGDLFTNNPDVYMAFEYAHILIFFIALMIILSSAYLSVLNYLTSVAYLNTDLYTMPELLDMYKTQNRSWWGRLTFHNFYLPNKLRSDFEFKILHNFFVSSYHVPINFDFGMYLCESLDLQIVELVEVDVLSWFGIMVMVLANMLRVEANTWGDSDTDTVTDEEVGDGARFLAAAAPAVDCNYTDYGTARRFLAAAAATDPCAPVSISSVETFAVLGWTIFFGSCLLMLGTHSAFMKLMAKAGCKTSRDYEKRLAQINKRTKKQNPLGAPIRRRAISGRSLMPRHKTKKEKKSKFRNHLTKMGEGLGLETWRSDPEATAYNGSGRKIYAGGADPPSRVEGKSIQREISKQESVGPGIGGQFSEDSRLSMTQLKSFVLEHQESEMHGGHHGAHGRGRRLSQAVNRKRSHMMATTAFGKSNSGPVPPQGVPGLPPPSDAPRTNSIDMHNFGNQIKQEQMIQNIKKASLEKKGSMEKLKVVGKEISTKIVGFTSSLNSKRSTKYSSGSSSIESSQRTSTDGSGELQNSDTMKSGGKVMRQMSLKTSHHRPRLQLDLRDIYWFGRADAFSTAVDFLLLLLCAYVAMMATNFGPLILKAEANSSTGWWMFVMALPAVLCFFPITRMINIVCKLKAVSVLDIEVVAKILEEHEEAEKVKGLVVKKFQEQMKSSGLVGRKALLELFKKVDTDESGFIDGFEFKTMLNMQQIFFTNKMFLHLFHAFDENNDNQISFEELEKVCFEGEEADLRVSEPESSGSRGKVGFSKKPTSKRKKSKGEIKNSPSGRKRSRDQRGITAIVASSRAGSLSEEGKKSSFNAGIVEANNSRRESLAARRRSYMTEKQKFKRKSLLETAMAKEENRKSLIDNVMVDIVRKASSEKGAGIKEHEQGERGFRVTKEDFESALQTMLGQISTNFLAEEDEEDYDSDESDSGSGSESMDFSNEEDSDVDEQGTEDVHQPSSSVLEMTVDEMGEELGIDLEKGQVEAT
ncbi:hypothetical protein TrST_g6429 [Triparma strigata]|uniref:EF-hand domain-containing protein n=1 Tax=Triparma strigata TaxID=1606541 RepID=A0A9W7EX28_9STRA|nr:hypothetical protein TrST_g6429 [Triparma strigata]